MTLYQRIHGKQPARGRDVHCGRCFCCGPKGYRKPAECEPCLKAQERDALDNLRHAIGQPSNSSTVSTSWDYDRALATLDDDGGANHGN